MKFFKSEKGEFTVEATIVFVISFITIIFMLYMGIIMYQHVHLQSATDRIASRGAMMYATRTLNMSSAMKTSSSFENNDPYRYIYDGKYKKDAKTVIETELKNTIGVGNVIARNAGDYEKADIHLGLFTRRVEVTGKRTFNVPFVSTFGLDNSVFDLNVRSTAYIMDMPETIRNVDFATDLLKRVPGVEDAIGKVSGLKGKLENFINNICK